MFVKIFTANFWNNQILDWAYYGEFLNSDNIFSLDCNSSKLSEISEFMQKSWIIKDHNWDFHSSQQSAKIRLCLLLLTSTAVFGKIAVCVDFSRLKNAIYVVFGYL